MYGWERQISGRSRWKSRAKLEKLSIFQGNQGKLFQSCPRRTEALFLHIFYPNYPSFYLKCLRKSYNFDFLKHFPKFTPFPPNFGEDSKFDCILPICILLKFDSAKLGVSNLVFFKSYRRKTFGDRLLVKEGLTSTKVSF